MRGFSQTNLKYMRMFAEAWPDLSAMGQRFVDPLPWGQNITLLTKLKTREERLLYAARAVEHGWSRPLLTHHIELRTLEREGKAVTNFEQRLPRPQSDLARETLKDPALAAIDAERCELPDVQQGRQHAHQPRQAAAGAQRGRSATGRGVAPQDRGGCRDQRSCSVVDGHPFRTEPFDMTPPATSPS